jgi:hypothetical protein
MIFAASELPPYIVVLPSDSEMKDRFVYHKNNITINFPYFNPTSKCVYKLHTKYNPPFFLIAVDFSMWLLAAVVFSTLYWSVGFEMHY